MSYAEFRLATCSTLERELDAWALKSARRPMSAEERVEVLDRVVFGVADEMAATLREQTLRTPEGEIVRHFLTVQEALAA